MNVLECHCRHCYRSGFELDVSFALQPGITVLAGPSGSGKTTVLEAIAGMLRPEHGRILLGRRVLFDSRQRRWLPPNRRRVGLVFQDYLLFPHMSVEGNLRYAARRRPGGRIAWQALIDLLDLQPLLPRYPATLSGGQRQRTVLGRALLSDPELLLMDEPINAQDMQLQARILDYLQRIVDEYSLATLLVSHDTSMVDRLGARCLQMAGGKLLTAGDD